MGGPNLEVFKFGMYIMFPIGIMYYFGTNLDSRFTTPDFWPKEHQTHRIPFDKDDINQELDRLKQRRLAARAQRLASQEHEQMMGRTSAGEGEEEKRVRTEGPREILQATKLVEPGASGFVREEKEERKKEGKGWLGWLR